MSVLSAGTPEVLEGRVEPGPVFVIGSLRIPWQRFGEACVGARVTVTMDAEVVAQDEEHSDAVSLLSDCLPEMWRGECPRDDLAAACAEVRASTEELWESVMRSADWDDDWPEEDADLWLTAAMTLVRRPPEDGDDGVGDAFAVMDPNDWLAAVIELVRGGIGTVVDAETLVALAARCLDVDSAANDRKYAPLLATAFEAVVPVWRGLGAIDEKGGLTALGLWGIPLALARAWGGQLV